MATELQTRRLARTVTSPIPRRLGPVPGATLVDGDLLATVGFTDHALLRFAERSGLKFSGRQLLDPIVRDLLSNEGLRVPEPPEGVRLSKEADFYMQAGTWLLFLGYGPPGRRSITTVVQIGPKLSWKAALARGRIATPVPITVSEPRQHPVTLTSSVTRAWAGPSRLRQLLGLGAEHHARQQAAARGYARALKEWTARRSEYDEQRARAHERHLVRHGFTA
jgi:hypothetical protein